MNNRKLLICFVICAILAMRAMAGAIAETPLRGPFDFGTLTLSADTEKWDRASPWKLPPGFRQTVVADERALNIYNRGRDDWHDMLASNESGAEPGRYLYRTHEVYDEPEGGAVSVVDRVTGRAAVLLQRADWKALDGIRWTPWNTLLVAEEISGGRLFEIVLDSADPTTGIASERLAVGRMAHEGIEVDSAGALYLVDEFRGQSEDSVSAGNACDGALPCGGGIYKFVPDTFGDLSQGQLYVLKIVAGDRVEGTGRAAWTGPIDAANPRRSGTLAGGQSYQRPEDVELIGDRLYVAITEGTLNGDGEERYQGRVIAIDLSAMTVTDFVKPGVNVPREPPSGDGVFGWAGFDNPDNLVESPDGRLVIVEDKAPSDIWFANPDVNGDGFADELLLFASLSDPEAEASGIYFVPGENALLVNIQHSAARDGDGTWMISPLSPP